jgi:heme o synthase
VLSQVTQRPGRVSGRLLYSLILAPLAIIPAFTGLGGRVYLAVAGAGGAVFLALAVELSLPLVGRDSDAQRRRVGMSGTPTGAGDVSDSPTLAASPPSLPTRGREARRLFAFSILYLFLLFAALLGERLAGVAARAHGAEQVQLGRLQGH